MISNSFLEVTNLPNIIPRSSFTARILPPRQFFTTCLPWLPKKLCATVNGSILENTCEEVSRNIIVYICTLGSLCTVFLYLTSMTKILNNTNKDRLLPHLPQNMECQARSSVSPLKLVLTWEWNVPIFWHRWGQCND